MGSEIRLGMGRGRGRGILPHTDAPLRRPSLEVLNFKTGLDIGGKNLMIEDIQSKIKSVKTSQQLRDLVSSMVDAALESQEFCLKLLSEVKSAINFTVEDKKLRNVFLSCVQSTFQEKDTILRISQERYTNLIYLLCDSTKCLRMPNGDPIIPLVMAVAQSLSPVLRGSITLKTAICIRKTAFSLLDDLWKHAPSECEDFFEKVRELVVRNALDMNIGNELLFLVELEHSRTAGEVPSAVFSYYREKGLKFE